MKQIISNQLRIIRSTKFKGYCNALKHYEILKELLTVIGNIRNYSDRFTSYETINRIKFLSRLYFHHLEMMRLDYMKSYIISEEDWKDLKLDKTIQKEIYQKTNDKFKLSKLELYHKEIEESIKHKKFIEEIIKSEKK